jgi:hypothetical protein
MCASNPFGTFSHPVFVCFPKKFRNLDELGYFRGKLKQSNLRFKNEN